MDLDARDRLLSHLRSIGYQVGVSGGWHRAALAGSQRPIVDVASHPVVNPRTFEELRLHEQPGIQMLNGVSIPIAAPNDLALLKLAAHRDQDIVDLLLLADRLSAREIAKGAQHDDIERTAAEGAQIARLLQESGALAEAVAELIGRSASEKELRAFHKLLSDLHEEGL